jgi:hypothetical protein
MRIVLALVVVAGLFVCSKAEALPLIGRASFAMPVSLAENVKIICDEAGFCYRPPPRRPVARWVYGDNNFRSTYVEPGHYGSPRQRYRWWPFYW